MIKLNTNTLNLENPMGILKKGYPPWISFLHCPHKHNSIYLSILLRELQEQKTKKYAEQKLFSSKDLFFTYRLRLL